MHEPLGPISREALELHLRQRAREEQIIREHSLLNQSIIRGDSADCDDNPAASFKEDDK